MGGTRSTYDYNLIKRTLNAKVGGRLSAISTAGDTGNDSDLQRDLINSSVRVALSDVDFRGNLREVSLTPTLTDSQYEYHLPTDVKGDKIVDFRPQVTDSRGFYEEYHLVGQEEFDRRKKHETGLFTIQNDGLTRRLRISTVVDDESQLISDLDNKNDQDTWTGFGAVNDSDVKTDADDYVEGKGSIRFQTDTSDSTDSTVGIQNRGLNAFDASRFLAQGTAFASAKLTTADTSIKQVSIRLGSDSSNYYQVNDSTQSDCSAFETGWNQLSWDLKNKTTTGSPVDTAINYAALFWSRDTTDSSGLHLNDTDWHFDHLHLKRGKFYDISYYSRFVWQDTALDLVENSTHDSHALLVQNDEFELIMAKAAELASGYLRDQQDRAYYASEYQRLKESYLMSNPSQARVFTTSYYEFESHLDTSLVKES